MSRQLRPGGFLQGVGKAVPVALVRQQFETGERYALAFSLICQNGDLHPRRFQISILRKRRKKLTLENAPFEGGK